MTGPHRSRTAAVLDAAADLTAWCLLESAALTAGTIAMVVTPVDNALRSLLGDQASRPTGRRLHADDQPRS